MSNEKSTNNVNPTTNQSPINEIPYLIQNKYPSTTDALLYDNTTSEYYAEPTNILIKETLSENDATVASNQLKEITVKDVEFSNPNRIKRRFEKSNDVKKERVKSYGEVFTPTWVIKLQIDECDNCYKEDDLETYVNRIWLEITCGEAPYIVNRIDLETNELIPIYDRIGFLDRKLIKINEQCNDLEEWRQLVLQAYKASFGFELNGDSLYFARENMLSTYYEFYVDKWKSDPIEADMVMIAIVIGCTMFQMDGLKYTTTVFYFDSETGEYQTEEIKARIPDWEKNEMIPFENILK